MSEFDERTPGGPEENGQPESEGGAVEAGPDALLRGAFDAEHYLARYPDVAAAGIDPLEHYRTTGWREGRWPTPDFDPAAYLARHPGLAAAEADPFLHHLTRKEAPAGEENLSEALGERFDRAFYLTRYPDVAASGTDPLAHYLATGWREGRWPTAWFDPAAYVARVPGLLAGETDPFLHWLAHRDADADTLAEEWRTLQTDRMLYWSRLTWPEGPEGGAPRPVVLALPLPSAEDMALARREFDAGYYLEKNPEISGTGLDPLLHFLTLGWIEGYDPSPDFSVSYYLRKNADVRAAHVNPFLHWLREGRNERWRHAAGVAEAALLERFETEPAMQRRIRAAEALEPMIAQPQRPRRVTSVLKSAGPQTDAAEALRRALAGKRHRYIVAVPHIRMAGAARVAATFARVLAGLRGADQVLVVVTDTSEQDYAHWYPADVARLDLAAHITGLPDELRIRCLLDVMRGVGCEALLNVHSRLGWEALTLYGRQMAQEVRLLTYLFCWDETAAGARVGYPVQWLRDTADHHHLLLTDSRFLATDISNRLGYALGDPDGHIPQDGDGAEVVPLYTPVDTSHVASPEASPASPGGGSPRVLWAGRFDRQKRLDILVAVARANPHIVFDVYGKPVLDAQGLEAHDPPANLHHKGAYADLSEVPGLHGYTAFLYTSQWDGIPTVLMEMAGAGLPLVASGVGGIGELVDETTGWRIDDIEAAAAYSAALAAILADPEEAARRVRRLRERVAGRFSHAQYSDAVSRVLERHGI